MCLSVSPGKIDTVSVLFPDRSSGSGVLESVYAEGSLCCHLHFQEFCEPIDVPLVA